MYYVKPLNILRKLQKKCSVLTFLTGRVRFFNLQKSFNLNDEQYEALMKAGHLPENLLNYEETPGASEAINKWVDQGHEVFIITGRPFNSYEPSRKWLDEHHLERVPLFCVDKYGRETAKQDYKYNMTLEELYNMTFDFAVEDSPAAFEHVIHFDNCRTAVFDRPWNSRAELPNDRFVRCKDWQEIDRLFEKLSEAWGKCRGKDKACDRRII